ncbi:MAG: hypothetical protein IH599_05530 [Bacteroidales bacterium]|nr:hypothetical protein [Bacteroidales bacterium]
MHEIEPHFSWLNLYDPVHDRRSPYFGNRHDPYLCRNTVYNYYIHPAWDEIGSPTLYVKVLYNDYAGHYAVIKLMGEWNDILYNDVMFLTRNLIEPMMDEGIRRFMLIGENVLNFHAGDADYYQEWADNLDDGWIALLNSRQHVREEFQRANIDYYMVFGGGLDHINWRKLSPRQLVDIVESLITKRLTA